jgi:hypothetical protein
MSMKNTAPASYSVIAHIAPYFAGFVNIGRNGHLPNLASLPPFV